MSAAEVMEVREGAWGVSISMVPPEGTVGSVVLDVRSTFMGKPANRLHIPVTYESLLPDKWKEMVGMVVSSSSRVFDSTLVAPGPEFYSSLETALAAARLSVFEDRIRRQARDLLACGVDLDLGRRVWAEEFAGSVLDA